MPDPIRRRGAAGGRPSSLLRRLPQVDELLAGREMARSIDTHGRPLVTSLVRQALSDVRQGVRAGRLKGPDLETRILGLADWVEREARQRTAASLRPVVNATGVVLHTNLGRAPLSEAALARVLEVSRAYSTLEYSLETGRRGSRGAHLERLLGQLFPGHAAHVVNNCAAAMLLALNTLAEGREVLVSRGELVEIGGSFRIPDIMAKSGAILREVGTTNRTRIGDFERSIGPRTGMLLKVHPSNYRIVGFTAQAGLRELAALARRSRRPLLYDMGSGCLTDAARYGLAGEPTVHEGLKEGADLVIFSGDNLLGGPQAGLLVGRPAIIRRARANPLARALRIDKMTCAALEATLLAYVRGDAPLRIPVQRMIALGRDAIEARARAIVDGLERSVVETLECVLRPGLSLSGGGSAPGEGLPTTLIAVRSRRRSRRVLEERLRAFEPPIIGRIEADHLLLDLRTVPPDQDVVIARALVALAADP